MSDNVVSLSGAPVISPGEPHPGVVEALEKVLAMAKRGELRWFVGTGLTHDHQRLSVWADALPTHRNVYMELGAIEWLKQEYVDRILGRVADSAS